VSSTVFISHSTKDKDIADAALSCLESNGLKCWIAPRDIVPGSDWAESLIDGIDYSSGLVLILSQHSNQSPQVRRELERAVSRGITIFPLVIEKLQPSKWMQYYISAHQWHDASDVPLNKALIDLVDAIKTDQDASETEPVFHDLSALLEDDLSKLSSMLEESDEEVILLTPGERRKAAVLHITFSLRNEDKLPSSIRKAISRTVQNLIEKYTSYYGAHLDGLSSSAKRGIFGLEKAVENDISRALTCGIQLFNGFSELNSVLRKKDLSIEFGLGVSTGTLEVVRASSESIDFQGGFLSKAKNLAEAASNEILASTSVYKLSKASFAWEEHGEGYYRISDYSLSVPESRILSVRSPFVGREEELSRLRSVLDQQKAGTDKNRRGGAKHLVMGISGEAGIGKSRLVHEFLENECTGNEFLVLKGQTLSYAQPPYWLWTTLLRNLLNIEHGSGLSYEEFTKRLRDYTTDEELLNSTPFLSELLSIKSGDKRLEELDNKAIVLETKIAFRNLLKVLSDKHRLVVVLEDIHWIGESSKAVLEFVLGNCDSETAVVFLLVYRPEQEDGRSVEFEIHSNYAITDELSVSEVSKSASEELIGRLLSSISETSIHKLDEKVKPFLLERSKGNPFYLEELVLDIVEKGILTENDQVWQFNRPPEEVHVPDSLTGLLQSRIDRLPEPWREVLQSSSVLGMEFQLKLYSRMANKLLLGRPSADTFDGLEKKQMLLSEISAFEKKYLFRHSLVHDTAYSSILEENLKQLHKSAAESIEEVFWDETDQVAGILMHHFRKAGDTSKALSFGLIALEFLLKSYNSEDVIELSKGLEEIVEELSDCSEKQEKLFYILRNRERALNLQGNREVQEQVIKHMFKVAEESACDEWMLSTLRNQGGLSFVSGRIDDSYKSYKKAMDIARKTGDRHSEGFLFISFGNLSREQGQLEDSLFSHEKALGIAHEIGNHHLEGIALGSLGDLHLLRHHTAEDEIKAKRYYELAIEMFREVGDLCSEANIYASLGNLLLFQGNLSEAQLLFEKALAIQIKVGNRRLEGKAHGNIGTLNKIQKRLSEARACYNQALEIAQEVGDLRSEGIQFGFLGDLSRSQGFTKEAEVHYEKALKIARKIRNPRLEGMTLCKLGRLHRDDGCLKEAQTHFKEALESQQKVGDRSFEGVILVSLAELCYKQSKGESAIYYLKLACEIICDLELDAINFKPYIQLYRNLIANGYTENEIPWPEHWEPIEGQ